MSDQRLRVHETAKEIEQKFDYFFAGLAGAVFVYSVQHFTPHKFDSGLSFVEPFALLLLILSLWFSFKRIESVFLTARLNCELIDAQSVIFITEKARVEHPQGAKDVHTGRFLSPDQMETEIGQHRKWLDEIYTALREVGRMGDRGYRYRFLFLVAGFAVLLIAKILGPYV